MQRHTTPSCSETQPVQDPVFGGQDPAGFPTAAAVHHGLQCLSMKLTLALTQRHQPCFMFAVSVFIQLPVHASCTNVSA